MKDTHISLTPFSQNHLALLEKWLANKHVARWFPEPEENISWAMSPPNHGGHNIIQYRERSVGYLRWQCVDRDTLDSINLYHIPSNSADIDILIGNEYFIGKGAGVESLIQLVDFLKRKENIPLAALTTSIDNVNAKKAFTKAGFTFDSHYTVEPYGDCILMTRAISHDAQDTN